MKTNAILVFLVGLTSLVFLSNAVSATHWNVQVSVDYCRGYGCGYNYYPYDYSYYNYNYYNYYPAPSYVYYPSYYYYPQPVYYAPPQPYYYRPVSYCYDVYGFTYPC